MRRVLAIFLCLLAGVVLQCVVAWVLFLTTPYTGGTGLMHPRGHDVTSVTGFRPPPDWDNKFSIQYWGLGKTQEQISEAEWMGSRPGFMVNGGRQAIYTGVSAGWPMRSLRGTEWINRGLEGCAPPPLVQVPAWITKAGWKLPVSPLWPGFMVNTLLYAGLVWGAVRCVPAWKRWRRRKRGLCEGCGYDLRGLPSGSASCPECGRAGSARPSPATIPP